MREIADSAVGLPTAADGIDRHLAKHAITLRLRFVEPLVGGALVREGQVLFGVTHDVGRLIAEDLGLHVDEPAGIAVAVIDLRDGATLVFAHAAIQKLNSNVEIDADLAEG